MALFLQSFSILTLSEDMPAKTMLFDQRVRPLHDFGAAPVNFISFNPQGRLIALAGFGNLAGKIEVFDRRTLTRASTIEAPNTSYCAWSPDGRFLLTATLSPRLRVDNGLRIWHCTGTLVHAQSTDELYDARWRPTAVENVPAFGNTLPPSPIPSASVTQMEKEGALKAAPAKPAGAYRPPGARGGATPSIFKREDEGGPGGAATPPRYNRSPAPGAPGYAPPGSGHQNGYGNGNGQRRQVPGAPPGSAPGGGQGQEKNRKRKGKGGEDGSNGNANGNVNGAGGNRKGGQGNGQALVVEVPAPVPVEEAAGEPPATPGVDGAALDAVAKKVRNLNKKVRLSFLVPYNSRVQC